MHNQRVVVHNAVMLTNAQQKHYIDLQESFVYLHSSCLINIVESIKASLSVTDSQMEEKSTTGTLSRFQYPAFTLHGSAHQIAERLRLEGTSAGLQSNPPAQSRLSQSRWLRDYLVQIKCCIIFFFFSFSPLSILSSFDFPSLVRKF